MPAVNGGLRVRKGVIGDDVDADDDDDDDDITQLVHSYYSPVKESDGK